MNVLDFYYRFGDSSYSKRCYGYVSLYVSLYVYTYLGILETQSQYRNEFSLEWYSNVQDLINNFKKQTSAKVYVHELRACKVVGDLIELLVEAVVRSNISISLLKNLVQVTKDTIAEQKMNASCDTSVDNVATAVVDNVADAAAEVKWSDMISKLHYISKRPWKD